MSTKQHRPGSCKERACKLCEGYRAGVRAERRRAKSAAGRGSQAEQTERLKALLNYLLEHEHDPPEYYTPAELAFVMKCSLSMVGLMVGRVFGVALVQRKGYPAAEIHQFDLTWTDE